jgi:hypothetical protein
VTADISELLAFAGHLDSAVSRAEPDLSKVVERGANNVKRGAQLRLSGQSRRRYLKHYPKSFSYDMLDPLDAEVGPDSAKPQGGMGRGVEFGSVHTGPLPHWLPAADEEEPKFVDQALRAWVRSLK